MSLQYRHFLCVAVVSLPSSPLSLVYPLPCDPCNLVGVGVGVRVGVGISTYIEL